MLAEDGPRAKNAPAIDSVAEDGVWVLPVVVMLLSHIWDNGIQNISAPRASQNRKQGPRRFICPASTQRQMHTTQQRTLARRPCLYAVHWAHRQVLLALCPGRHVLASGSWLGHNSKTDQTTLFWGETHMHVLTQQRQDVISQISEKPPGPCASLCLSTCVLPVLATVRSSPGRPDPQAPNARPNMPSTDHSMHSPSEYFERVHVGAEARYQYVDNLLLY